jgi:hypothetical protein
VRWASLIQDIRVESVGRRLLEAVAPVVAAISRRYRTISTSLAIFSRARSPEMEM